MIFHHGTELILILIFKLILLISIVQLSIQIFNCALQYDLNTNTPISKNVVGENGEWQLSNGNCTTERNCGFHTWYAKTMSSSRSAKLLEGA